jgi:3-hydroxy acid dehydrogenase / malonic semialdehyde reductase
LLSEIVLKQLLVYSKAAIIFSSVSKESIMSYSLKNKIVFITGASSGIGAACAQKFAEQGARLVLCARRLEKLKELAEQLKQQYKIDCHIFQLDVSKQKEVAQKLSALPAEWQAIDILVNNAGLARGLDKFHEGSLSDWEEMIDINVKGLLYVTKQILPGMVQRNSGHIINVSSLAGYETYPKGNVYCATKQAVNAITRGLRMDLFGTKIRVSSVAPGAVETEFSNVRFHGNQDKADAVYKGLQPLVAEDIADIILYCASCPPHVNISELIVLPTAQACATMIHRE